MSDVAAFTKRCCLVYFRDRASVFFSLMGVFIVILLYLIFLRSMEIDSVINSLPAGFPADRGKASSMVDAWVLAGILAIVPVTSCAGISNIMVNDRVDGKDLDMRVTGLTPAKVSWSYVLSTYLVGQIMSIVSFVIVAVFLFATGCLVQIAGLLLTLALTVPASLSGAIIIYACTCRMRSGGAFSGFFTVTSVLIGFLTGIYMPMGSMEGFMRVIGTLMPATHMAALMRQTLGTESLEEMFMGAPQQTIADMRYNLGYDLELFGYQFTPATSLLYVLAVTAVFFGIAVLLTRKRR